MNASIYSAAKAGKWVKEHVIPSLTLLTPYLQIDPKTISADSLPKELVLTPRALRNKFYDVYIKWKNEGAEIWSDANFPVETNFLSAIVKDGKGARDMKMPYR